MIEDTMVVPVMTELAACLCEEIARSELPEVCFCGIMSGELVLDWCGGCSDGSEGCGGQAWVRFVDAFPSSDFPAPAAVQGNCKYPWAFNVEVGIARCAPLGAANQASGYTPPSVQAHLDAFALQMADLAAMRRAIQCCFGTGDRDYVMNNYEQVTVNGGDCLGGVILVSVGEAY